MLGIALVKRDNNLRDRVRGSGVSSGGERGGDGNGSGRGENEGNMFNLSQPQHHPQVSLPRSSTSPGSGAGRIRPVELGAIAVVVSFLVIRAAETALRASREQHRSSNHINSNRYETS